MTYFIAEIGVNWKVLDDIPVMMHQAKCAGAQAVKVQVFHEENIEGKPFADQLKKMVLHKEDIEWLSGIAHGMDLNFVATPMYPEGVNLCRAYVDAFKVRYLDRNYIGLIDLMMKENKPIYISCDEEYAAKPPLEIQAYKNKALLFCVPEYPPKQIRIPRHFKNLFDGFSSHYLNWMVPATFGAMGASPIECHVWSPELYGTAALPDRQISLSFQDFGRMVYAVTGMRPKTLRGEW